MKILGIDPGYDRCGIALISKDGSGSEDLIFSTCLTTSAKLAFHERLKIIGESLEEIIHTYQPDALVMEELYFSNNAKTVMQVSEARGVIEYIGAHNNLPLFHYHPNAIKIAITGNGRADKQAILAMIPRLIPINDGDKKLDDEIDAIAVALTHLAHYRPNYPQI